MLLLFFREFVVSPALETKRSCFHLLTAQYDSPMKRAQRHEEININQQTRLAFASYKETRIEYDIVGQKNLFKSELEMPQ